MKVKLEGAIEMTQMLIAEEKEVEEEKPKKTKEK